MKKTILSVLSIASMISTAVANQSQPQDINQTKCEIIIQAEQSDEMRKISTSTILQGVATSCNQLGKLASAKGSEEKQKETCNFIASFFQLIADASKENEENHKNKRLNNSQKNENSATEAKKADGKAEEKKAVTDETIKLVLGLVDILNENESAESLRCSPSTYISMLRNLPDGDARTAVIGKILSDKNESATFLEEIIATLEGVLFVSIPEITTALLNSLKNIFAKTAPITTETATEITPEIIVETITE
jgi:hypothetical protein